MQHPGRVRRARQGDWIWLRRSDVATAEARVASEGSISDSWRVEVSSHRPRRWTTSFPLTGVGDPCGWTPATFRACVCNATTGRNPRSQVGGRVMAPRWPPRLATAQGGTERRGHQG